MKQVDRNAVEARIHRILVHYKQTIDTPVLDDLVERDHRRAGAELGSTWGLPEPIIEPNAHDHDDPAKASRPVKMVMMSDILVAIIERRQVAAGSAATEQAATAAEAAALGPTSAVWPTSFSDPPGAPEPKSGTWATDGKRAKTTVKAPSEPSAARPAAQEAAASQATASTPKSPGHLHVDLDAADFAKLEVLGMSRELAEMILTKIDESLAELPL